jgi:hypothetical protein
LSRGDKDFEVDRPVTVDDAVAKPSRPLPGHGGEPGLHLVGHLYGRLAEHGVVPQQLVPALPRQRHFIVRDIGDEALDLLYLAEQEQVTPHTADELQREPGREAERVTPAVRRGRRDARTTRRDRLPSPRSPAQRPTRTRRVQEIDVAGRQCGAAGR